MKLHAKRLLSLLMAMVMALSFAAPVVAEHLDEDAAPETSAVSAQEADAQESASQDQVPEISGESEEDASEEEAVSDSSAQEEQEAPEPREELPADLEEKVGAIASQLFSLEET
jgi:cobalamin biosynthesis protein CobT